MEISIVVLATVLVLVVLLLVNAIRIVPEFRRPVIFRLGRCICQKGPGLVIIIPVLDRPFRVDLRELFLQIPHQTCISRDNAPISIDFLVCWRVVDPALSVVKVRDFASASQGIATTTLRAVDDLKALGASPSTKIVFPLEFPSLLRPLFEKASYTGQVGGILESPSEVR